jgi:hypothetical protein
MIPSMLLWLQAQEQLLEVPWPAKLLEHPYCAPVHLGAACTAKNPAYAAAAAAAALDAASSAGGALKDQGPLLMAGLRVRMGINTGWLLVDSVQQHSGHATCTDEHA